MKYVCIGLLTGTLLVSFVFPVRRKTANRQLNNAPVVSVNKTDTALLCINGYYYYRQQLFSGVIKEAYTTGITHHEISCCNGKEEGWTITCYPDGRLSEKRYYHLGEKDGVHTGWWQNGKPRFEYHFTMGLYNGDYREWYNTGNAYKHIHYSNGAEDWGKGWRENGRPFMNFTMQNGRRYGIVNSNLCYTIKNEQGAFATPAIIAAGKDSLLNTGNKRR